MSHQLSDLIHDGFTAKKFGRWIVSDLSTEADRLCAELFHACVFGTFKHVEIKALQKHSSLPMYKFAKEINADELKRFTALVQYAQTSRALARISDEESPSSE